MPEPHKVRRVTRADVAEKHSSVTKPSWRSREEFFEIFRDRLGYSLEESSYKATLWSEAPTIEDLYPA